MGVLLFQLNEGLGLYDALLISLQVFFPTRLMVYVGQDGLGWVR